MNLVEKKYDEKKDKILKIFLCFIFHCTESMLNDHVIPSTTETLVYVIS